VFRGRDLALILLCVLGYCGAIAYLWPLVSHFHHKDLVTREWIEYTTRALLIPFGLGFLLAVASDRSLAWNCLWAAGSVLFAQFLMWFLEYLPYANWDWSAPVAILVSCIASAGGAWAWQRMPAPAQQ
jgi:hypothetical protein